MRPLLGRTFRLLRLLCGSVLGASIGCVPELGAPASLIQGPRVLAVRSEPAEAAPREGVQLRVYPADTMGPIEGAEVEWAFCTAPKPPVENNVISDRCLTDSFTEILGRGLSVMAQVPDEACMLFGPQLPPQDGTQSPRPRDADATGGYYQPVRARVLGITAIGLVRIRCGLANATPQAAAEYRARYVSNRNPGAVDFGVEDGPAAPSEDTPEGSALTLKLLLDPDAAEPFLFFRPADQTLRETREMLRVSWFSSLGRFAESTTAAAGMNEIRNTWHPPVGFESALLWAVLRDSRGGTSVFSRQVRSR